MDEVYISRVGLVIKAAAPSSGKEGGPWAEVQ